MALKDRIIESGQRLGFSAIGITHANTLQANQGLQAWLSKGYQGEMDYMVRHAELRANPALLHPGTVSVISAAIDYLPHLRPQNAAECGEISRYAQGRDYHKVVRGRLQKLAEDIAVVVGPFGYRVFSDSAPVHEVQFAYQAGLGWRGKHTLLLSKSGSWRFLGELYTDIPFPADKPVSEHCGTCTACIKACPTGAIVAPYHVDARLCISYLTIELKGDIPVHLRSLIGNRIYGCDDCQIICPWNRFAKLGDREFRPRHNLDASKLIELFNWNERDFDERLAGNPIRRIGHQRWLRNIAVALGNGPNSSAANTALRSRSDHESSLVRTHVAWALERISGKPKTV